MIMNIHDHVCPSRDFGHVEVDVIIIVDLKFREDFNVRY